MKKVTSRQPLLGAGLSRSARKQAATDMAGRGGVDTSRPS